MTSNAAVVLSDFECKDWESKHSSSGASLGNREIISDFDFFRKADQLTRALKNLIALPPNWDSYGANRINLSSVTVAFNVLMDAMREGTPAPSIVPTPSGHVQFEWHLGGIDLEVEVISPININVLYKDQYSDNPPQELTLSYDLTPLNEFVAELTRRA